LRAAEATPTPVQEWSGGFFATYAHDGPGIRLFAIRQDRSHLTGTFSFENMSGSRAQAKDFTFQSVHREDQLWPVVYYEVRRDRAAPWERIGQSSPEGKPQAVTIKADSAPVDLYVTLDMFKPLIEKYVEGRIVLDSAHTSQFDLKDLAPGGGQ
jgi:hypothetical protein